MTHFLINQHFSQNKPIQVLTTIKSVLLNFLFSAREFSLNQISDIFRHVYMSINDSLTPVCSKHENPLPLSDP